MKELKANLSDRSGFDSQLKELVEATSVPLRLRKALKGQHLLFFDRPAPNNFSKIAKPLCELLWLYAPRADTEAQQFEQPAEASAAASPRQPTSQAAEDSKVSTILDAMRAGGGLEEDVQKCFKQYVDAVVSRATYDQVFEAARERAKDEKECKKKLLAYLLEKNKLAALRLRAQKATPGLDAEFAAKEYSNACYEGLTQPPGKEKKLKSPTFPVPMGLSGVATSAAAGGAAAAAVAPTGAAISASSSARQSETWPLPGGGSIRCVYSREAFMHELETQGLFDRSLLDKPLPFVPEDPLNDYFEPIDPADQNPGTAMQVPQESTYYEQHTHSNPIPRAILSLNPAALRTSYRAPSATTSYCMYSHKPPFCLVRERGPSADDTAGRQNTPKPR